MLNFSGLSMTKCAFALLRSLNSIKFVQTGMNNVKRGNVLQDNTDSKNKIITFGYKDSNEITVFYGNCKFYIQESSYQ